LYILYENTGKTWSWILWTPNCFRIIKWFFSDTKSSYEAIPRVPDETRPPLFSDKSEHITIQEKVGHGYNGLPTALELLSGFYKEEKPAFESIPNITDENRTPLFSDPSNRFGLSEKVGHGYYGRPTALELLGGFYGNTNNT